MFQKIHSLTEREYRALIGISKKDFTELTVVFSECDQKIKNEAYENFINQYDRKPSSGGNLKFKTPSEKLFFTLFYLKTYPTFDVLGFVFNCKGKTAHENFYKFLPILERALGSLDVLPKRAFYSVEQFLEFIKTQWFIKKLTGNFAKIKKSLNSQFVFNQVMVNMKVG